MVYGRDNFVRFAPFDARSNSNRGNFVDQVMQNNKVFGGRLTITTPIGDDKRTKLVWGADYIQERSNMPLDTFDAAPTTRAAAWFSSPPGSASTCPGSPSKARAPLASCSTGSTTSGRAEGGLRYEKSQASFADFQPLSQSRLPNRPPWPVARSV
ncbi:hypothetical protein [Comamonas sp. JC664]|uniref:hypothetical protein n=1 Tax=Comamonas sp. JC664 TaxID=2801917 RepID=UPI003617B610